VAQVPQVALRELFDLDDKTRRIAFDTCVYPWEALRALADTLDRLLSGGRRILAQIPSGAYVGDGPMFIAPDAVIEPGCYIAGPAFIGPKVTVRHGAYVRSNVLMLAESLLGHSSEAKGSIFLPGAKAPHFAYVGDSILGSRVNMGAGTKLSNLPITPGSGMGVRPTVRIPVGPNETNTGLTKLGAIIGDDVEIGCNAVLGPGTVVGPRSLVYPNLVLRRGVYAADKIFKLRQEIVANPVQRR